MGVEQMCDGHGIRHTRCFIAHDITLMSLLLLTTLLVTDSFPLPPPEVSQSLDQELRELRASQQRLREEHQQLQDKMKFFSKVQWPANSP